MWGNGGRVAWGQGRVGEMGKVGQGRARQSKPVNCELASPCLGGTHLPQSVAGVCVCVRGSGRQSLGGLGRHALRLLWVFFLSYGQRLP